MAPLRADGLTGRGGETPDLASLALFQIFIQPEPLTMGFHSRAWTVTLFIQTSAALCLTLLAIIAVERDQPTECAHPRASHTETFLTETPRNPKLHLHSPYHRGLKLLCPV